MVTTNISSGTGFTLAPVPAVIQHGPHEIGAEGRAWLWQLMHPSSGLNWSKVSVVTSA